jgi:hypothetical protein
VRDVDHSLLTSVLVEVGINPGRAEFRLGLLFHCSFDCSYW